MYFPSSETSANVMIAPRAESASFVFNLPESLKSLIYMQKVFNLFIGYLNDACPPVKRSQIPMQFLVTTTAIPASVDKLTESIGNSCLSM